MNLEGKYTIINKNNVKTILTFLYRKGYYWCDYSINLYEAICDISEEIDKNEKLYIVIDDSKYFLYYYDKPTENTYINLINFLREDKLKLILKTKSKRLLTSY